MARKHAKKFSKKCGVDVITVTPAVSEKKIVTNPVTGEFEVTAVTSPAVFKQGKAFDSTSTKGNRNVPPDRKGSR